MDTKCTALLILKKHMTNQRLEGSAVEPTTCLILGPSDARNLALLNSMLRMPSRWVVIGERSSSVDALLDSVGRKAFECFDVGTQVPTGPNVTLLEARR